MRVPGGLEFASTSRTKAEKDRGDREKRRREREADRDLKTTMTDFRIVGIEVKELGWTWGLVGDEARKLKDEAEGRVKIEDSEALHEANPLALPPRRYSVV